MTESAEGVKKSAVVAALLIATWETEICRSRTQVQPENLMPVPARNGRAVW